MMNPKSDFMIRVKKVIYILEIGLGLLGIIAGVAVPMMDLLHEFSLPGGAFAIFELPLILLDIGLMIILPLCLFAVGFSENQSLLNRFKNKFVEKIGSQFALLVLFDACIMLYPYSFFEEKRSFSWSVGALGAVYVMLPSVIKFFVIAIIGVHVIVTLFDLYFITIEKKTYIFFIWILLVFLPVVIFSAHTVRMGHIQAERTLPPKTLMASDYFLKQQNFGLPAQYIIQTFEWDPKIKQDDAVSGLHLLVGESSFGYIHVRIALFSSDERASQRFQRDTAGMNCQSIQTGEEACFERNPEGMYAEDDIGRVKSGKVVLEAQWRQSRSGNTENQISPIVLDMLRTLTANVRQDFVKQDYNGRIVRP